MRFIADESCDFAVVRALREAGFDVTAVGDVSPGAMDNKVIELVSVIRVFHTYSHPDVIRPGSTSRAHYRYIHDYMKVYLHIDVLFEIISAYGNEDQNFLAQQT